ncbi:hypothetical protein IscW_ISCW023075 [Ixodes scapularis]|uniref:Uncharacterized protein n=1 Tax=Ixodes scapularis TaxID=6945 RepID=B7QLY7_IXOSC|nr:hypothetical protein IscW_ISCW023075 [Ixodes scapularis]|eukprot:XP_002416192.1 hypothetical protein IscW_ISCW023075 [Ixodes scapularis]
MAKKKWRLKARETSTDVPVVKFSHGSLKSGQRLRTDVYEHKETIAGRVRTRRILVSESDGVQYVGENFGEHSVRANALCKHFIGVEDVPSGKNKDATIPQEVYRLEDIIPPVQNGYLDELAEPFLTADADDVVKWRSEAEYPDYVLQRLGRLSRDPLNRVLEARMLIYYHMLIQVSRLRYTDLKRKDPLPNIDAPLKHILLDTFTLTSKNERGMTSRTFPERMNDKVLAYILVLVLILEDYKYDFGLVQPDTKAANMRMTTLSYALGCHVGSHKLPGSHVTTKFLELKLPLVDPSQQHKNKRVRT